MMAAKKDKDDQEYICCICGKTIYPDDAREYVKTRRHTELRFHTGCMRRYKDVSDQKH